MLKINRKTFWELYREKFVGDSVLPQLTVDGLNFILDRFETEDRLINTPQFAYVLATAYHESGKRRTINGEKVFVRFQPVKEGKSASGSDNWEKYQRKYWHTGYYGRGLVQITWKDNYAELGRAVGVGDDFVENPDLVLLPKWAYEILVVGMVRGLFRKTGLQTYFPSDKFSFNKAVEAREIVNGDKDKKEKGATETNGVRIAKVAQAFYEILKVSQIEQAEAEPDTQTPPSVAIVPPVVPPVVPPAPTAEPVQASTDTKEVEAPEKENSTKQATTMTIAGITVPAFLVGIIQAIQSAFEKGYIDGKQVCDALLGFLTANTKYVFFGISGVIAILVVKKVFKQLSFMLTLWINGKKDMNDVEIVKK